MATVTAPARPAGLGRGAGSVARRIRRRFRDPSALVGTVLVATFALVALLAPILAPHSPTAIDLTGVTAGHVPGPSAEHPLGQDPLGRDVLSRLIYGARTSLVIAVASVSFGLAVGAIIGTVSGAIGGWLDAVLMRIVDVMLSIPGLLFAIGLAALLGPGMGSVMLAIGTVNVPIFARLLRGSVVAGKASEYVEGARALGVSELGIVLRHVLPNSTGPIVVAATLALATAIIDAAGLAFLGLASPDPGTPEWGKMLADTQAYLAHAPHLAIFPGIAITLSVLGFYLLGESLQESFDPQLQRRA